MATCARAAHSVSQIPVIDFEKIAGAQHACETARSRSTSAGTSNSSRSSNNTGQYSVRTQRDGASLWSRFQESLKAAQLELTDVPFEEKELTELLGELGFSAVERARLRRECRARPKETPVAAQRPAGKIEINDVKEEQHADSPVNECVFLTGDFFGDDVGIVVGSVVDAGLESPSAQAAASELHFTPAAGQIDENVFLTGDFFGDDVAVALPTANPFMERLHLIPPPPLAPPLVNLQYEMPLAPPPAEAPALECNDSEHLPSTMPIPEPMQQAVLGLPELQKTISGLQGCPSIGSAEHHMGTCKPCAYFGERGCENGAQCQYCHLCPPGELKRRQKVRRSAQRRMRFMNSSEY